MKNGRWFQPLGMVAGRFWLSLLKQVAIPSAALVGEKITVFAAMLFSVNYGSCTTGNQNPHATDRRSFVTSCLGGRLGLISSLWQVSTVSKQQQQQLQRFCNVTAGVL